MDKYFKKLILLGFINLFIIIINIAVDNIYLHYFTFTVLSVSTLACILYLKKLKGKFDDTLTENAWYENKISENNNMTYKTKKFTELLINDLPYAIVSIDPVTKSVTWYNDRANEFFNLAGGANTLEGISKELSYKIVNDGLKQFEVKINDSNYQVYYDDQFSSIAFYDITENYVLKTNYRNRKLALAMIRIDYYDELVGSKDIKTRADIQGTYFSLIAQYASKYNVSIQAISESTFLFIMDRKQLRTILKTDFDLLDIVRGQVNKNNVKLTISIGVASYDILYDELYEKMTDALELAESRGGDQAVIDIEGEELVFLGGTVEAVESRSKVKSRVMAGQINSIIEQSDDIYIIPHNMADTDAIGASIGVNHLVSSHGKKAKIVLDRDHIDKTSGAVLDLYARDNCFVSLPYAVSNINENSLIFVVDHNNEGQTMVKNVVSRTKNVVVIDHHRKNADTFSDTLISYIEPYASSTCELVAELIYFTEESESISYEEATIMYSGIIVDTNNFQTRTGSRTFEVASYLRSKGADISFVKLLLRSDYTELVTQSTLVSQASIYRNHFIITISDEILERVILAKVANKLMDVKDAVASFAIARASATETHVSARSIGGLNVQKVMEHLGGGGHLTGAAAVIKDKSPEEVAEEIKEIINSLEEVHGNYIIR